MERWRGQDNLDLEEPWETTVTNTLAGKVGETKAERRREVLRVTGKFMAQPGLGGALSNLQPCKWPQDQQTEFSGWMGTGELSLWVWLGGWTIRSPGCSQSPVLTWGLQELACTLSQLSPTAASC